MTTLNKLSAVFFSPLFALAPQLDLPPSHPRCGKSTSATEAQQRQAVRDTSTRSPPGILPSRLPSTSASTALPLLQPRYQQLHPCLLPEPRGGLCSSQGGEKRYSCLRGLLGLFKHTVSCNFLQIHQTTLVFAILFPPVSVFRLNNGPFLLWAKRIELLLGLVVRCPAET